MKKLKATRPMLPLRIARLHGRLLGAAAFGLVVSLCLTVTNWSVSTKLLAGWNACVLLYLILIYSIVSRCDIDYLRKRAAEEDEGALAMLFLSCAAGVASLGAIVLQLGEAKNAGGAAAVLRVVFAMGTVILSWAFVHTTFALHYAHEYYGEGRDRKLGGLRFPGGRKPDYWDFIYFSAVIAMTSQVSDVVIESHKIRRVVTVHGILSFFFNLGVLALTVNMMSGLIT
jgi:uncharacterized membrane protein